MAEVNDQTVKFTLNKPYSPIAHTFFSIKITSQKEVESQGAKFGTQPNKAGTGPYFASAYAIATGLTRRIRKVSFALPSAASG